MRANTIRSHILAFIEVFHSPERAFARDLSGPSYVIPFLILSLVSVFLSYSQSPIQLHWTQLQLELSGAPAEQIDSTLHLLRQSSRLAAIFLPLLLLLRWLLFSALLWIATQLALNDLKFEQTFRVVAYSYFPNVVRDAVTHLVLRLRSDEALLSTGSLRVAIGLDLLFPNIPLPWSSLAGNLNLFDFWYIVLLVIGISNVAQCRWQRSLSIIFPCWLFVSLLQLALVNLGLHLQASASPNFR